LSQQQAHCRQLEASLLESHKASTQSLAALSAATREHTSLHTQITDLSVKVRAFLWNWLSTLSPCAASYTPSPFCPLMRVCAHPT